VVIPTRNEPENVVMLHERLERALEGIEHEVVVVDDSNDGTTRPALASIVAIDARWRVIERAPAEQTGLSTAVVAGVAAARGAAVCVMDGDLQHPPEAVPALLLAVEDGADIAVASRYASGGSPLGLSASFRRWGSRAATVLTHLAFPETRRTTDPVSGFFCSRRAAVAGLELRPVGFKVLVELLVCAPHEVVADVPYRFQRRTLGESKADALQAFLYLKHLVSLFVYVPGSGRPLKFVVATAAGLATFLVPLGILLRSGAAPLVAWLVAVLVGASAQAFLHRAFTFRELFFRGGRAAGGPFHPSAVVSLIAALAVLALLLAPAGYAPLALAAFAWCVAMLAALSLTRIPGTSRGSAGIGTDGSLARLGRKLGAEHAYWASDGPGNGHVVSTLITPAVVRQTAQRGLPVLLVESPSRRPQSRVNLERESALLIPLPDGANQPVPVAILTRRSRNAFTAGELDLAVRWMSDPAGGVRLDSLSIATIGLAAAAAISWVRGKLPTAWRFLTVGAAGIGVNQLLLWLIVDGLGIQYLLGAAIASQGSTAFNFAWLEGWVFRGRTSSRGRILRFIAYDVINSGSLAVRLPVMFVLTSGLHVHYLVSNVIALVLSTVVRFLLSDGFIWSGRQAATAGVRTTGVDAMWRTSYRYSVDGLIVIESEAPLPELAFFATPAPNGAGDDSGTNGHGEPDLVVQVDRVGGLAPRRHASVTRDGSSIVYRQHLGSLVANFQIELGRPVRVLASPGLALSPHVLYTNVVEPLLRFLLIRRQRILLHAACISMSGTGVLVSAKTDTGKTSTILRVLSRNEGQFLSDDMTILDATGVASRYPKPLTISAHTLGAVPTNRLGVGQRAALALQSRVHSRSGRTFAHFLGGLNVPFMAINAGVQLVVPPPKYAIDDLIAVPIGREVAPSHLFLIERGTSKLIEEVSVEEAVEELLQNSDDAYGFPPYTELAPRLELDGQDYQHMLATERAILTSALQSVTCVRMRSGDFDWHELIEGYVGRIGVAAAAGSA
jgi:putative flippase GtrA